MSTIHNGVWYPDDRASSVYQYVPVEVPAGHRALTVELSYDRGAGVLDLGCFTRTAASAAGPAAPGTRSPLPGTGPLPATCPGRCPAATGR